MICEDCAFGADVMAEYRANATQGIASGEDAGRVRRWLRRRAKFALAPHRRCERRDARGCTCQHRIRELESLGAPWRR